MPCEQIFVFDPVFVSPKLWLSARFLFSLQLWFSIRFLFSRSFGYQPDFCFRCSFGFPSGFCFHRSYGYQPDFCFHRSFRFQYTSKAASLLLFRIFAGSAVKHSIPAGFRQAEITMHSSCHSAWFQQAETAMRSSPPFRRISSCISSADCLK